MVKLRARCIVVGDATVGKSALSQVFRSDGAHFQKIYSMTTGVELMNKCVNIPNTGDSVELYIYDSPGKEIFADTCEKMWGQPNVACVVFDISSKESFDSCDSWLERVKRNSQGAHVPGVLVGNKCDLAARREVEVEMAKQWAHTKGLLDYIETSAKEVENCDIPFLCLAQAFHSLSQEQSDNTNAGFP